jgi:F-type H+-transporting ATPase subunit delta
MSELSTLARPYAEAVFKRSIETDTASAWSDMLNFLAQVVENVDMQSVLVNPKVSKAQRIQLVLEICQDGFSDEGRNFIKLLCQNDRFILAAEIQRLYESFRAEHEGYVDVEVTSAYALSKEEQKKFVNSLEAKLNKKVHIKTAIDKTLIGGFIARAGDKVIDGSVAGQLQQLARKL